MSLIKILIIRSENQQYKKIDPDPKPMGFDFFLIKKNWQLFFKPKIQTRLVLTFKMLKVDFNPHLVYC